MSSKHTPGPWGLDQDAHRHDPGFYGGEEGYHRINIPGVTDITGFCGDANAHLIKAAPDLYEALLDAETYFDDRADVVDGDYGEPAPNNEMTLLTTIRAALARAKGAQS
jgi:hypothetical protein